MEVQSAEVAPSPAPAVVATEESASQSSQAADAKPLASAVPPVEQDDQGRPTHKDLHTAATVLTELRYLAEKKADSVAWIGTEAFFAEASAKWDELDAGRTLSDQWQAFEKARSKFQTRHTHHLELKKVLTERETACAEVERLLADPAPATQERFNELTASWAHLGAVPAEYWEILEKRFKTASQKYLDARKKYDEDVVKRQAATERLGILGPELEALAASTDWKQAEARFAEIEKEVLQLGMAIGEPAEWKQRYITAFSAFHERKAAVERERDRAIKNELAQLVVLCDELDRIAAGEEVKANLARVREIQVEWDKACHASKEQKRELNKRLDKSKKAFYDKLALSRQSEDLARWENYAAKLILCEKAEALRDVTVINDIAHGLKDLRAEWKKSGPAPREKADEVWKRFDTACEAAYARCKEFYDKLHEDRAKNLEQKTALCEKAEALRESNEWKATSELLKDMQAEWKTIGRCEPAVNEEIYKRFRAACDAFFERWKLHREEIDRVNDERKKLKEALCADAEALTALDWNDGFEKAKDLQRRWKEVGLARKNDETELWAKFNGLVEAFFARIDTERPANQAKKEELVEKVKAMLGNLDGDIRYNEVADALKELSNQWNKIGPTPKEKEKELREAFNAPMKDFYEKRQKFLDDARRQRVTNLEAKLALIAKIEAIAQANENWLKATDEVRKIQDEWKNVGSVPRDREDEVRSRYQTACDAFFGNKREFFDHQRKDRLDNLGAKRKLCERLERLVGVESAEVEEPLAQLKGIDLAAELKAALEGNSTAFAGSGRRQTRSETFDEIRRIQDEWKRVGPVPKEHDEPIYQRYRRACDVFFNNGKRPPPPDNKQLIQDKSS